MTELLTTQSLYDQDILLWVEDTVTKLKARDFANLDLENLIEENVLISIREEYPQVNFPSSWLENCDVNDILNRNFWEDR
jgi:hypothetical protein